MSEISMPTYDQLMQPTLEALRHLQGRATGLQIYEQIISDIGLPLEIATQPHAEGDTNTEVEYRLMWTRTYLKRAGYVDNPERGTWELTELGWNTPKIDPQSIVRTVRQQMAQERGGDQNGNEELAGSHQIEEHSSPGSLPQQSAPELYSPTPYLPSYTTVRHFARILDGVPYSQFRAMENEIRSHRGTPQDPVDWADPDHWIPERLSGASGDIALRLWQHSKGAVNPRHTRGSWYLCTKHDLLVRNKAKDMLELTELGQEFVDHEEGQLVAQIDADEGLLTILRIVSEKGSGRRSDLLSSYEEYSTAHTTVRSDSALKSYLYARLTNLIDRDLVRRRALRYEITDAGLTYLERYASLLPGPFAATETQSDIRKLAKTMREDARQQLRTYLLDMDPYKFEDVIKLLLEEMGYDNVETTAPTSDKGVDVVGQIELGITSVREVIQVKRHRGSINRPVLDQLRGSLHRFNAVRGTIITTGRFSSGSESAAFERGAAPITLIDGEKLLDLLMDNQIGVAKKAVEYYEFDSIRLEQIADS